MFGGHYVLMSFLSIQKGQFFPFSKYFLVYLLCTRQCAVVFQIHNGEQNYYDPYYLKHLI